MKKGILGICLTLVLCLGLLPTTALAASGDTYLALGDSITTGYAPNNTIVSSPFANIPGNAFSGTTASCGQTARAADSSG